jgi:arylformamidase
MDSRLRGNDDGEIGWEKAGFSYAARRAVKNSAMSDGIRAAMRGGEEEMPGSVDPFEITALVPDFDRQMAAYEVASAAARARLRSRLDVRYGEAPRQRLDLFFPDGAVANLPIHLFIHGGYWRAQAKDIYSFVAESIVSYGAIAAIVDYSLLPSSRMDEPVGEVRRAVAWLAANAAQFGGNGAWLSASGHSAGAHLCSYLASRGPHEAALPPATVGSVVLLSGIYDLRPIATSYLQAELSLTAEEVARWSPVDAVPAAGAHIELVVGEAESAPFHQQAQAYAQRLSDAGASVACTTASALDHMSIVRELGWPDRPVSRLVAAAIDRSRSAPGAGASLR